MKIFLMILSLFLWTGPAAAVQDGNQTAGSPGAAVNAGNAGDVHGKKTGAGDVRQAEPGSSPFSLLTRPHNRKAAGLKEKARYRPRDINKVKTRSDFCIDCHREKTPGIFSDWLRSVHARTGVGCDDCHGASRDEEDAFLHADKFYVSSVVSPFDCAKCHPRQMRENFSGMHAWALENLRKIKEDDPRYPLIEKYRKDDFRQCAACHGIKVTLNAKRRPDAGTWPNSGVGRINPDGSHGNCAVCHTRHRFSVASARRPQACTGCHDGASYPEAAIYLHSPHGQVYETTGVYQPLDLPDFYCDSSQFSAPTCALCHMNGAGMGLLTRHDPAWRLPRDLTAPGAPLQARSDNLRGYMKSVCMQCHAQGVIVRFFEHADRELETYQRQVVEPRLAEFQQQLEQAKGPEKEKLLREYGEFLAQAKAYRLNLYMGQHGRTQR